MRKERGMDKIKTICNEVLEDTFAKAKNESQFQDSFPECKKYVPYPVEGTIARE